MSLTQEPQPGLGPGETLERLPLSSADPFEELREALRDIVPEAFDEQGQIDPKRLKESLGYLAEGDKGRYNLSWAGKLDAQRALQILSTGALTPKADESVDFETTQNAIIEGDNLEVLKLLQKSYHGKVKMIYIDPPYNTGNDFIYPDNFREGLQTYLEYTGQAQKKVTQTEENLNRAGRVHSNWLNMMYPRLALARNLLREDGVIFVSIDDHEVHNLRMLMDEVFGEENFVSVICWQNVYGGGPKSKQVVQVHEYALIYARQINAVGFIDLPPDAKMRARYTERDDKYETRGPFFTQPLGTTSMDSRPNLRFPIDWNGNEIWPEKQWQWSKDKVDKALANDELVVRRDGDKWSVRYKQYLYNEEGTERASKPYSVLKGPYTQVGTAEIVRLLGENKAFPFPKPVELLKHFISFTWRDSDAIILDFFAGSGTTAQAVMELNQDDGGNRRFILVQLPEPLENPIALVDGTEMTTIADICRERVRRAAKKVAAKSDGKLDMGESKPDLGFRAFSLNGSNFKLWQDRSEGDTEKLAEQLKLYAENILPDRPADAILFEILLKSGYELSVDILEVGVEGETVFSIADGSLLVYLADPADESCLREMIEMGAEKIVCLDHGFRGNDALKANIAQQVKQHNAHHPEKRVEFRTV